MSALKNYFQQEVKASMLALEHPNRSDFYISGWQTTRSVVPLLIWRIILFLATQVIILSSVITYMLSGNFRYWFIYLTHWGLITILLATGFSVVVSARIYFYGPISAEFSLPWYVKTYWVLFNIAIPIAFLITIFYWTLLYGAGIEEELNHGLDVAVHGLNSLIVLALLLSSSQPSRLLHIYQPLIFGITYTIFGLIYHFAGGVDTHGNAYIYPVVNWSEPSTTALVVVITALLLIFLHLVTMAMAAARDALTKKIFKRQDVPQTPEGLPLRQPAPTYA